MAFIGGLKGGPAPSTLNLLDNPPPPVTTAVAAAASSAATIHQTAPTAALGPAHLVQYTTIQQPIPSTYQVEGFHSLDAMVRQTAAGCRSAGALAPGFAGGGFEGNDLSLAARRVLHAQRQGIRSAGSVTSMPPWGELPPLSSYPPPVPAPAGVHPAPLGDAASTPQLSAPIGSPYVTQQRTVAGGSTPALHSTARSTFPGTSGAMHPLLSWHTWGLLTLSVRPASCHDRCFSWK